MVERILHIFGIHDWVPRFVVIDGVLVRRGTCCSVCHRER
jgi:hypothetical protein